MIFELSSDPYIRHSQRLIVQGQSAALPVEPEAERSNVFYGLDEARTRKWMLEQLCRRGRL
jgi:hypothetical protein